MTNAKVEQFSRDVITAYHDMAGSSGDRLARAVTIGASAQAASDRGLLRASNAADVAKTSIDSFREKTQAGMEPREAAKATAKEIGERFDAKGRDTQRHERQRSNDMSL